MPRTARATPGGYAYHILNRGVGRTRLFSKPRDYEAFLEILAETLAKTPLRVCGFCLMPNHWHFVVWPEEERQLARFFQRLTITHAARWARSRGRVGEGHVYQGRYKSFPIEADEHFYQVERYVERNALRANLATSLDDWRWGSYWIRGHGTAEQRALLAGWPVPFPRAWQTYVTEPATEAELAALRRSVQRGAPYGGDRWVRSTASALGLESTLRARGRPKMIASDAEGD